MTIEATTSWTVTVSRSTASALRATLAEEADPTVDVSAFVEEAVRWCLLDQSMLDAHAAFADLDPEDAQALLDEAVDSVRAEMRRELADERQS
jgi:regulator of sirC expression with transglutaminase-like and TPR domain